MSEVLRTGSRTDHIGRLERDCEKVPCIGMIAAVCDDKVQWYLNREEESYIYTSNVPSMSM